MFKKILCSIFAILGISFSVVAADSEPLSLTAKEIKIVNVGFPVEDFRISDNSIVSVEKVRDQPLQLRIIGIGVGKSNLQVTGNGMSKIYNITVNDNIREVFNALRKDLSSVPELDISINRNKIVLKGEIASLSNWDILNKVLPEYKGYILNLVQFRPAPEVMLSLKKLLEKSGYDVCDKDPDKPGKLSLRMSGNTLILKGQVYNKSEIAALEQIVATQEWITIGKSKEKINRVKLVMNIAVCPTLLDVGVVFVGVKNSETSTIGANLLAKGLNVNLASALGTMFAGDFSRSLNLNMNANTVLNLMADSGCSRFHRSGHLTFLSNDSDTFKTVHEGGTIKVRITPTLGGGNGGGLENIPYGFMLRAKGGLIGDDMVRLNLELEVSTPNLQANGDYDVKQSKISTVIQCKLGETVALGGVRELTEGVSGPSGIPFLRRVPVLNWICAETGESFNDSKILILVYPQVAGKTPALKMPPSAETRNTLHESEINAKNRSESIRKSKKSFWERWF